MRVSFRAGGAGFRGVKGEGKRIGALSELRGRTFGADAFEFFTLGTVEYGFFAAVVFEIGAALDAQGEGDAGGADADTGVLEAAGLEGQGLDGANLAAHRAVLWQVVEPED